MKRFNVYLQNSKLAVCLLGAVFLVKLLILILIGDYGWEPDSYQHFNELRTVFANFPDNLSIGLGVWAKPLYTFPLGFLVVAFGISKLIWIQIINLLIFTINSFLVYLISQKIYRNNLVSIALMLLTSFSLTLFISSLTALTEPIFLLNLLFGVYFTVQKNYYLASLFFGLSVLGRIEGLFFAGIFGLWLAAISVDWKSFKFSFQFLTQFLKSNFKFLFTSFILIITPVFIWNFLGFIETGSLLFIFEDGYPTEEGIYGFGSLLYYPARFLVQETVVSGLFVLGSFLLIVGATPGSHLRRAGRKVINLPRRQTGHVPTRFGKSGKLSITNTHYNTYNKELTLLFILSSGFLLTQIITWNLGTFGSAGLMRYFVSILPMMIIIGGVGLIWIMSFSRKLIIRSGGSASSATDTQSNNLIVLTIVILFQIFLTASHLMGFGPLDSKWIQKEENLKLTGEFIRDTVDSDSFLGSDRPGVIYYSGRNLEHSTTQYLANLEREDIGYYVWTEDWGEQVANVDFEWLESKTDFVFSIDDEVFVFSIEER